MIDTDVIIWNIKEERKRQDAKWGEQNHHPLYWLAILQEEVGEAAKACIEHNAFDYQKEMIQVAAVAIAALESLARQGETEWWEKECCPNEDVEASDE